MAGNTVWGANSIGQALAGLRVAENRMKRLAEDSLAMNKPGFTRANQDITIAYVNGQAYGVDEGPVTEATDSTAENDLRSTAANAKRAEKMSQYLKQVEQLLGQMGQNHHLATTGNRIVTALNAASADITSVGQRRAVIDSVTNHLNNLKFLSTRLQDIRSLAEQERITQINDINDILTQIANLNAQMPAVDDGSGNQIGYLRQRRALIDKLGEYIALQPPSKVGDFILQTSSGQTIVDGPHAAKFLYNAQATITAGTNFNPIQLQTISIDPSNTQAQILQNVTNDIISSTGALAGLTNFLETTSAAFSESLDVYAAGFRNSINAAHNLGSVLSPRSTIQGTAGYIGGIELVGTENITAQGILRIALIDSTTHKASYNWDIDISAATTTDALINTINTAQDSNSIQLNAHITASIQNGALCIAVNNPNNQGIALGSVSGQPEPTIGLADQTHYGFSQFFHLNDLIAAPASYDVLATSIAGLSQKLSIAPLIANDTNASHLAFTKLRNDAILGTTSQAVSSDSSVIRNLMDLFNKTATNFPATQNTSSTQTTFEKFAIQLVQDVANKTQHQTEEMEAQQEAYKQQSLSFSEQYGLSESEIAALSLEISKSQDLYFHFINTYYHMMKQVAEMGR